MTQRFGGDRAVVHMFAHYITLIIESAFLVVWKKELWHRTFCVSAQGLVMNYGWPGFYSDFINSANVDNYHNEYNNILSMTDVFDITMALKRGFQVTENFGLLGKPVDRLDLRRFRGFLYRLRWWRFAPVPNVCWILHSSRCSASRCMPKVCWKQPKLQFEGLLNPEHCKT